MEKDLKLIHRKPRKVKESIPEVIVSTPILKPVDQTPIEYAYTLAPDKGLYRGIEIAFKGSEIVSRRFITERDLRFLVLSKISDLLERKWR